MRKCGIGFLTLVIGCRAPIPLPDAYVRARSPQRLAISKQFTLEVPSDLNGPFAEDVNTQLRESAQIGVSPHGEVAVAWIRKDKTICITRIVDEQIKEAVSLKEYVGQHWDTFGEYDQHLVWDGGGWNLFLQERSDLIKVRLGDGEPLVSKVFHINHGWVEWLSVFSHKSSLTAFWQDTYYPWYVLPDTLFHKVRYRSCAQDGGQWGHIRTLREYRPLDWIEGDVQIVPLTATRYDCFFQKRYRSSGLYHLPDILRKRSDPVPVGPILADSSRSIVALPLADIIVLWLEEFPYSMPTAARQPTRVVVAEYGTREGWSPPQILAQAEDWDYRSLAAAVCADQTVYAVWRDASGYLTYMVRNREGIWGEPVHTSLSIGSANWLVPSLQSLVLVSLRGRNLYWCRLQAPKQICKDQQLGTQP